MAGSSGCAQVSSDVHTSARERVVRATFSDIWDGTRRMEMVARMSVRRGRFLSCNLFVYKAIEYPENAGCYSTKQDCVLVFIQFQFRVSLCV